MPPKRYKFGLGFILVCTAIAARYAVRAEQKQSRKLNDTTRARNSLRLLVVRG